MATTDGDRCHVIVSLWVTKRVDRSTLFLWHAPGFLKWFLIPICQLVNFFWRFRPDWVIRLLT